MKPLAILLVLTAAAGADDLLPAPLPKARYAETIATSPFVLETKAAEPEVAKVNPFQNLYLRGVGKADGKDYVLIQRLGEERPMKPFIANEPGDDQYVVKSVRIGDSFRDTKVVLQKGGETGEIGFKEDTINAPPAAAGQARAPMPGQVPKPGAPMPGQAPGMRPPQPNMPMQAVPRPGGAMPMPQPVAPRPIQIPQTPAAPNGRIRVINNK